ncbi:ABC transporter ATP-binding protein [bacterium]|nr:ABC transporter ATP-binding protein [bacterium]
MGPFRHVIKYVKKSFPRILLGFLVLLIVDVIQLIIPILTKNAIDRIQTQDILKSGLVIIAAQILGLTVGIMIMRFFWRMLIIGNSFIIEKLIRHQFYEHLMRLSQNFFNRHKIGDLMAHATNDLNAVRMMFGFGLIAGFDIIVMTIASLSFMIGINGRLTLYAIIPMPIITISILYFGKRLQKRFGQVQESFSSMSGTIQESISGIRVVKAFVQEDQELEKVKETSKDYVQKNISMAILDGVFHPFMGFIISISMLITLILGGQLAINGTISIGDFYAFNSYLGMLIWPMMAIGMVVNHYQRGTASLKRLNVIFDAEPQISDKDADHSIKEIKGKIEIDGLNFVYPDSSAQIFENINTSIEKGKTLAIVGKTGCGKSTLIDLITRVYNPPKNSVLIDGHDVHKIPLEVLHRDVVMVPQDIFLFSETLANNIALGRPDASREEIAEATKLAQVYDDIMDFEHKFDTIVGERGTTLSGGQKQRVAIARALLCNPQVLILDDALSAVDTLTEKNILNHLIEYRQNKTTIIISHRISSVSHADKIIVIDEGKIVESGNHLELLALNGIYKDLDDKQKIEERLEGDF